ncbi:MAG: DUF4091 domain-containing protein [Phycisphaerae bacterium]|nr:DUF4091 domain-containing protein [Phycisphaerae bacterium]
MDNNNEGSPKVNFGVFYADGTSDWHNNMILNVSKDWEYREYVIPPGTAPITRVQLVLMFRGVGKVALDEFSLRPGPKSPDLAFDYLTITQPVFGDRGIAVSGLVNAVAKWKLALSEDGKELAKQETEGRLVQWFCDRPITKPLVLEITAHDKFGTESLKRIFKIAPASSANRKYCVWPVDSMEKVMPETLPSVANVAPLLCSIELARNETEGIQLAIRRQPGTDIGDVKIEVSDLLDSKTMHTIPASAVKWFEVGYLKVAKTEPHPKAPTLARPGWFPEALLPMKSLQVKDDNTMSLWLNVSTMPETKPGLYQGTVTLTPDKAEPTKVTLLVKVWDFSLPKEPSLKTAFDLNYADILAKYGAEKGKEMPQKFAEYVVAHRIPPQVLYGTRPMDLDILKNVVDDINIISLGASLEGKKFTKNEVDRQILLMDDHFAKAKALGLYRKGFYYAFDEFMENSKPDVKLVFGEMKRLHPEILTMCTTTTVSIDAKALKELNIDILCLMLNYYDKTKAKILRKQDPARQVWGYISFQPGYPYIHFKLESPLIESRLFSWQCYQQELDGFLSWGLNQYWQAGCTKQAQKLVDPDSGVYLEWNMATNPPGVIFDNLNGDGKVLLYGKDGPIGSIRFENFRDSMEDYEYLNLAKLKLGEKAAMAFAERITKSFTEFSRDPVLLRQVRRELAAVLEENVKK